MKKLCQVFMGKLNFNAHHHLACSSKHDDVVLPSSKGPQRSFRDAPPAHYTCMIRPFSSYSMLDRLSTPVFEEGGYKWNLSLYPDGNKNENGDGHLSLYLVIADTDSQTSGWEVKALVRLFLFNHIHGKYLMVADTHERHFHAMKKEWGFSQFIPLRTFKKPCKGYVFDDTCVIGAEVFILKSSGRSDRLSMITNASPTKFEWKIEKFSESEKKFQYSKVFTAGEYKWKIKLCLRNNISLFLSLADSANLSSGQQVFADYTMCVKDPIHQKHVYCTGQSWFSSDKSWLCGGELMSLAKFKDRKKGFLADDTCIIKSKVTILGVTNTTPSI